MKKAFGFLFSLIYVLVGFSGCDLFGEGGSSILKVYYARAVYTYNFNIYEIRYSKCGQGYEIEDGKVKFTLLGTIQKPSGRLTVKYVVNE